MTYRIVLRNFAHRRMRTSMTVVSLGAEVCLILLIWGLTEGLVQESNRRRAGAGADILIRPAASSTTNRAATLSSDLLNEIEALPPVELAVGTIVQMQSDSITVTGVRIEKFARMAGGLDYLDGGPFEGRFDAVVDRLYAQHKKLAVGGALRVLNRDFRVAGITETGKLSRIFVPLETMRALTGDAGRLNQIYVKLRDPEQTRTVIDDLKQRWPSNQIYSMEEVISLFAAEQKGMAKDFITLIVGLVIAAGFLTVILTMYTIVLDRTRELGILKALGASRPYIVRIFLQEATLLALAGVLLGIAFAHGAQWGVHNFFPLVTIQYLKSHIGWVTAIAFIGSILGTLWPALWAAGRDAIEALAYE